MKKIISVLLLSVIMAALSACGDSGDSNSNQSQEDDLKSLNVEFEVPEKANVGETVELKAVVTYGEELVTDADEVAFEYWEQGNEENSTTIEANNNGDGTYTAEVSFDSDGIYEIYAHTTARDLHTMPKKAITVGDGVNMEQEADNHDHGHGEHDHAEGFGMHFVEPEDVKVDEEVELVVHLQLDNEPLRDARVRYEMISDNSEKPHWVETEESNPGEYTASFSFDEAAEYTITIHVENDEGLHEHEEYTVVVN